MYDRFTDSARKVMRLANQEAQRFNHDFIGTEHILLGLLKEGSDVAAHVLKNLGLELRMIRLAVEKIVLSGPDKIMMGTLAQSPRAKKVIEYSIQEAKELNHNYVGTEHLLLGLIRQEEGVAFQVLKNLGVGRSEVRREVLNLLGLDVAPDKEWHEHTFPLSREQIQEGNQPTALGSGPAPRRWRREEYYRMGDLGFFREQRVELIEGEIMVFYRQKAAHYSTAARVGDMLSHVLEEGFWVRTRMPLSLSALSEPEPDVSVVLGRREGYRDHPTTAVLIVEVSEGSLAYDRMRKASVYARADIGDYWIVNLVDRQLEVHRDPRPDASQPYGDGYASVTILVPPSVVSPLALPQVSLAVADLLP